MVMSWSSWLEEEEEEEKLYFNNLLHVHQHTSMKYMIYDTVGYWGKKSEDKYVCMRYSPIKQKTKLT